MEFNLHGLYCQASGVRRLLSHLGDSGLIYQHGTLHYFQARYTNKRTGANLPPNYWASSRSSRRNYFRPWFQVQRQTLKFHVDITWSWPPDVNRISFPDRWANREGKCNFGTISVELALVPTGCFVWSLAHGWACGQFGHLGILSGLTVLHQLWLLAGNGLADPKSQDD